MAEDTKTDEAKAAAEAKAKADAEAKKAADAKPKVNKDGLPLDEHVSFEDIMRVNNERAAKAAEKAEK